MDFVTEPTAAITSLSNAELCEALRCCSNIDGNGGCGIYPAMGNMAVNCGETVMLEAARRLDHVPDGEVV